MPGITYTIKKNRLRQALIIGGELDDDERIRLAADTGIHRIYLRGIDSAEDDADWGRFCFQSAIPEEMVLYVYAFAVNEPVFVPADDPTPVSIDEFLVDETVPDEQKKELCERYHGKRFVGRSDLLLHGLKGRILYLSIDVTGTGEGMLSRLKLYRKADTWEDAFPDVYRRSGDFFHRFLAIYNSIYNDMEEQIDVLPELLDIDTCPASLLPVYASWMGIDLSGGYLAEETERMLVREAYQLNRIKGTRACIERLLSIVLNEKPLIIEQNTIRSYEERGETMGMKLIGESIYDVNILVRKPLTETDRSQLMHLIDQFRPARSRIHLLQLSEGDTLDGNVYLDINAQVAEPTPGELDARQSYDGGVVLG